MKRKLIAKRKERIAKQRRKFRAKYRRKYGKRPLAKIDPVTMEIGMAAGYLISVLLRHTKLGESLSKNKLKPKDLK